MKKQLTKIIAPLIALLIMTSLLSVTTPVTAQITPPQEKAMHFMETMLPVDLSKYSITLQSERMMDEEAIGHNRKITSLRYQLTSENSDLSVSFSVEKDNIALCSISTIAGQIIPKQQYSNQFNAVKAFLEKYQTYTQIDSSNLIAMIDGVDLTKDSTITAENLKLSIHNSHRSETEQTSFYWTYTIDGLDYTSLELIFDKKGNFDTLSDTRVVFRIGDTSIKVSLEQAIDIALENLQSYSYKMPDGTVVKNFKTGDIAATLHTIPVDYVDYELRPYWDVRIFLDDIYPGNVFGVTVFIWANTGEIISYSNMATGGGSYSDVELQSTSPNNILAIVAVAIIVIVVVASVIGLAFKKKHK